MPPRLVRERDLSPAIVADDGPRVRDELDPPPPPSENVLLIAPVLLLSEDDDDLPLMVFSADALLLFDRPDADDDRVNLERMVDKRPGDVDVDFPLDGDRLNRPRIVFDVVVLMFALAAENLPFPADSVRLSRPGDVDFPLLRDRLRRERDNDRLDERPPPPLPMIRLGENDLPRMPRLRRPMPPWPLRRALRRFILNPPAARPPPRPIIPLPNRAPAPSARNPDRAPPIEMRGNAPMSNSSPTRSRRSAWRALAARSAVASSAGNSAATRSSG